MLRLVLGLGGQFSSRAIVLVSGQLPPDKNCPPVSFGVWVGLVLWLGATKQLPPGKLLPPRLGLGFELRLVLELGGNFPQGQLS